MARTVRWLSATAVTIGGTLAGFFGYHLWQDMRQPGTELRRDDSGSRADTPAHTTDASADAVSAPSGLAVPEQLPAIVLPDLSGQPRPLRSFLGRPLIVNFWATWCAPCRQEIPLLQQLRSEHRSSGLEVVGIAVDFRDSVRDYVSRVSIPYPILIGEDKGMMAAEKFGMQPVLPFSVFVLPDGRILTVKVGQLHRDEADALLQMEQRVAAGRVDLAQARSTIAQRLQALAIARAQGAGKR